MVLGVEIPYAASSSLDRLSLSLAQHVEHQQSLGWDARANQHQLTQYGVA